MTTALAGAPPPRVRRRGAEFTFARLVKSKGSHGARPMGTAVNAHILEASKKLWGKRNHCEY